MARVTVEDCVVKIPNRFELVVLAGQRARDLADGAVTTVETENDKHPVIALREIADGTVESEGLRHTIIYNLQKHADVDDPEEDDIKLIPESNIGSKNKHENPLNSENINLDAAKDNKTKNSP